MEAIFQLRLFFGDVCHAVVSFAAITWRSLPPQLLGEEALRDDPKRCLRVRGRQALPNLFDVQKSSYSVKNIQFLYCMWHFNWTRTERASVEVKEDWVEILKWHVQTNRGREKKYFWSVNSFNLWRVRKSINFLAKLSWNSCPTIAQDILALQLKFDNVQVKSMSSVT